MSKEFLKFSTNGNAKLPAGIATFSLPSGFSCPGAKACLARADRDTGKLIDGKDQEFRCFSAVAESVWGTVRAARWHNLELLKKARTKEAMFKLLAEACPRFTTHVRVHVAGDFFSQNYFDAWMLTASAIPDVRFYAYTKSLQFWVARLGAIPKNFTLIASRGGEHDALIDRHELPSAVVVQHPEEAAALGLTIDHDDSLARAGTQKFALLLHGMQKAGSKASASLARMRSEGVQFSYSR